ncbi:MAG: EAL domain-containing protein [Alphaproteobacteria bacterium]|nr:EAL domain-containing protein [Alphaproteobacteria bacterium]
MRLSGGILAPAASDRSSPPAKVGGKGLGGTAGLANSFGQLQPEHIPAALLFGFDHETSARIAAALAADFPSLPLYLAEEHDAQALLSGRGPRPILVCGHAAGQLDGVAAAAQLANGPAACPVIVFTPHADAALAVAALRAGAADCVTDDLGPCTALRQAVARQLRHPPRPVPAPLLPSPDLAPGEATPDADSADLLSLQAELREALYEGRLQLHYQPRVDLATRRVVGAEALLRWPHPRAGMISPAVFIPLAERSGLILDIGRWVAASACADAAAWDMIGLSRPITISMNVSSRQLEDRRLATDLLHAMAESGLPPELLEIEITETRALDTSGDSLLALTAVRDLGVSVALDDFGTGFSSLSHLRRLPLTTLKIDRTFVRDLPHDRDDATIVRALVDIGRGLDLRVVAEGVETAEQLAFLRELGCAEGQGYFFCPPVSADALAERIGRIQNAPA